MIEQVLRADGKKTLVWICGYSVDDVVRTGSKIYFHKVKNEFGQREHFDKISLVY